MMIIAFLFYEMVGFLASKAFLFHAKALSNFQYCMTMGQSELGNLFLEEKKVNYKNSLLKTKREKKTV